MIKKGSRWADNRTEAMRLWMREKRKERKRLGRCVTCGSLPAVEGMVTCTKCRERDATRNRKGGMEYEDSKGLRNP